MALRLEALRLRVGTFRLDADLAVPAGAFAAVMGPSGGGKSTLLSAVAGFLRPEAGRIVWDGQDLGPLPPGRRPVAVLFQDNNLFPHLDALRNVALGLRPSLRPTRAERERATEALAAVGLAGLEARRPSELSGGQQGRAALARALVSGRPLVLMDEPFAALGPAQRREMLLLSRARLGARGATALLVTHDPAEARAADMVVVVAEGRAAPPVPPARLFADPPPSLRAYLHAREGGAPPGRPLDAGP